MNRTQLKKEAEARFLAHGFPSTKEEAWCFTDVSALARQTFSNDWKKSNLEFQPLEGIVVVFENGKLSPGRSSLGELPPGVRIGSIAQVDDPRIGSLAGLQSGFVAANTAAFSDGAFIEIADGVELDAPIHLVYLADLGGAVFHLRNLVSVGADAKATILEEYVGDQTDQTNRSDLPSWTNAVTEVFVAEQGALDHYKIQRENSDAFHFQTLEAVVEKAARFSNHTLSLGGRLGRNDIRSRLAGQGGEAICNGLYLLNDRQHFDTHLFVDHAVAACNSRELYKGILDEKARAVFCGRILVRQDAQQTDAVQSNRNLLLSRGARVNTLPQLEIYADDVKCTHGATIGELDETALYYLQTRGIDPVRGKAMLTGAFANEVLDEMRCAPVKTYAEALVRQWLGEVAG